MKLIKSNYEILEQKPGLEGIYEMIETAGRTCYRSQRPEGTTAKDFVDRMIKSQHYAMLEHGTVYLLFSECCYSRSDREFIDKYTKNPYSKVVYIGTDDDLVEQTPSKENYLGDILGTGIYGNALYAITTNYRVLVENDWLDDLKYLCEPTEFHEKRVTVRFTTDRGVSHEFVRHRVFSFAQESTRYCNYSKDKFGNELTFIIPSWLDIMSEASEIHVDGNEVDFCYPEDVYTSNFLYTLRYAERAYLDLLQQWDKRIPDKRYKSGFRNNPWTPQQARAVLPNALKTELVMTGFVSDWKHFFDLRAIGTTGAPHPDAKALVEPLMCEFKKRDWL